VSSTDPGAHHVTRTADEEVLRRGIDRILDGALNHQNEEGLARSLGVSPRHLRRIFRITIGMTPDQLARSCRAHLARRLLDGTELSVTEVALASGFGSVRQFNRSVLDVFGAAPLLLRARRRLGDASGRRPALDDFVDVIAAVCRVSSSAAREVVSALRSSVRQEGNAWPWADEGGPSLLGPAKAPSDQAHPH